MPGSHITSEYDIDHANNKLQILIPDVKYKMIRVYKLNHSAVFIRHRLRMLHCSPTQKQVLTSNEQYIMHVMR